MSCAFGFDVGHRRIGVAIGNRFTATARDLAVLCVHADGPSWFALDNLQTQWQPDTLIVGLPLTLNGAEQAASTRARHFARQLSNRYALPVMMIDERYSSQEAACRFALARAIGVKRRHDATRIDAHAAALILERWLVTDTPSSFSSAPSLSSS